MGYGERKHKQGTPRGCFDWIMSVASLVGLILLGIGILGANNHNKERDHAAIEASHNVRQSANGTSAGQRMEDVRERR